MSQTQTLRSILGHHLNLRLSQHDTPMEQKQIQNKLLRDNGALTRAGAGRTAIKQTWPFHGSHKADISTWATFVLPEMWWAFISSRSDTSMYESRMERAIQNKSAPVCHSHSTTLYWLTPRSHGEGHVALVNNTVTSWAPKGSSDRCRHVLYDALKRVSCKSFYILNLP